MKRLPVIDIAISTVLVGLIILTFAPAVARIQRTPAEAKCQSNMKRWSEAIMLYVAENNGRFPTNRYVNGALRESLALVPLSTDPTQQVRFKYGTDWVEALYPYIWDKAARTGQNWTTYFRCPNASSLTDHAGATAKFCAITYSFNYNLVENCSGLVGQPAKVMMLRELDRLCWSRLRPSNYSTGDPTMAPQDPFLTTVDLMMYSPQTNPNLHGNGSYIAFADSHVHFFTTDYYPNGVNGGPFTMANCWDTNTQQWFNYGPGSLGKVPSSYVESIAITP